MHALLINLNMHAKCPHGNQKVCIWVWVPVFLHGCSVLPSAPGTMDTETGVLRMYYPQLRETVNPSDIAAHLYANGLINDNERADADNKMHNEGDRMDRLLPALHDAIGIDEKNFYIFMDILERFDTYKLLVQSMRDYVAGELCVG